MNTSRGLVMKHLWPAANPAIWSVSPCSLAIIDGGSTQSFSTSFYLTHWGRVTHICVGSRTSTGSDNGLSPGRRQAIIWTNGGILLIGPLGTNFIEILIEIQTFLLKNIRLKMSRPQWVKYLQLSWRSGVVTMGNRCSQMWRTGIT